MNVEQGITNVEVLKAKEEKRKGERLEDSRLTTPPSKLADRLAGRRGAVSVFFQIRSRISVRP